MFFSFVKWSAESYLISQENAHIFVFTHNQHSSIWWTCSVQASVGFDSILVLFCSAIFDLLHMCTSQQLVWELNSGLSPVLYLKYFCDILRLGSHILLQELTQEFSFPSPLSHLPGTIQIPFEVIWLENWNSVYPHPC